ncbi:MAG: glycosyltransferase family 9 protein, partial [Candidatus Omnitrophica bacterium]|nr:glycosyltransferase family 9 protein [Candidatus Omnitrophota bacterium]
MNTFHNILIVRTDRIGDVVLTTPAIRAVKNKFPQSRLTVLVSPLTYDLIHGLPWIDEIMVDDRAGLNKGIMGFCHLVHSMRYKKFDLAVVFHTKRRTNLACFLAGIPYRMGYKNNKYGFLLNHPVPDERHTGQKHESEYCLDLLG